MTSKIVTTPSELYFIPAQIQKQRLKIIKSNAVRHGFRVAEVVTNNVTHILTEIQSEELALKQLPESFTLNKTVELLSLTWFFDYTKTGNTGPIEKYKLKRKLENRENTSATAPKTVKRNPYSCFKATLLNTPNLKFIKPLEILAKEAEFKDDAENYSRALAFRKACTALKQTPEISDAEHVKNVHDIGKHSAKIIEEILEEGFSEEATEIENSTWFRVMNIFTSIYGVGPAKAKRWYDMGLKSLEDVIDKQSLWSNDQRICYGLAYHSDLNSPMTLNEADNIKREIQKYIPGFTIEITGGFRRGKTKGHDLDLLITSAEAGKEKGILEELFSKLQKDCLILHGKVEKHTNSDKPKSPASITIDNFDKCFTILKYYGDIFPTNYEKNYIGHSTYREIERVANSNRSWKAKRVDLVVCPYSQWAYALLGWTGNKQFNRSLRDYAKRELNMRLTNHGLYDTIKQVNLPANDERQIFSHLKLNYLEPWERNA